MIKSTRIEMECPVLKKSVSLDGFYYEDDRMELQTTPCTVEGCDSAHLCKVQPTEGKFDWTRCPLYGHEV